MKEKETIGRETFEYERPMIDVTNGGLFGRPDTQRVYVAGGAAYRINGQDVSEKEFLRRFKKAKRQH